MEPDLKQRIIGTIVVTALAAIFIPMLFDEPVDDSGKEVAELTIPKPPVEADLASRVPASKEQVLAQGEPELSASELNDEETVAGAAPGAEAKTGQGVAGDAKPGQDFVPPGEGDPEAKEDAVKADRGKPGDGSSMQDQAPALDTGNVDAVKAPEPAFEAPPSKRQPENAATPKPVNKAEAAAEKAKSSKKTKTESPKKSTSRLVRWSIQAGSFSKKENAQSLVDKLRKQGLPATIVTKGNLYRVKVGPELDKKKAAEMKAKLDRQNITSYLHSE